MHGDSTSWKQFTFLSFGIALGLMVVGIVLVPVALAFKAYLMMGVFFLTGSCFTLAKTLRDEHESKGLSAKIESARAERLLREYNQEAV